MRQHQSQTATLTFLNDPKRLVVVGRLLRLLPREQLQRYVVELVLGLISSVENVSGNCTNGSEKTRIMAINDSLIA